MDKVRTFLVIVYQQRFWVLSVVGVLVAVVCWQLSSSSLEKEFTSNLGKIESQFNSISTLNNQGFFPNPQVNEKDLEQAVKLSGMVESLWQELYDRQRKEVLSWPKVLGPEFVRKVEPLKFGDTIDNEMREQYLNYIKDRFNGLLEIVKAKKVKERGSQSGGYGSRMEGGYGGQDAYGETGGQSATTGEEEEDYIVLWPGQTILQQELRWASTPSTLKTWVTQENLWVYETLLKVIAETNNARGATRPDNAAIRIITALDVGGKASANKMPARIHSPLAAGGGGGEEGMAMGMGNGGEGGMGGGEGGMGYGGEGGEGNGDAQLLTARYLDAEGNPVDGEVETLAEEPYRRLPVRMILMMEQRWISQLLVFCANQALPIEVQGLRVNPGKAAVGFGAGGSSRSTSRMRGVDSQVVVGLATVYLRGVVSIYNPPSQDQLTVPGAEEGSQDQFAENSP
jgi:hypothetical protein